jgi:hypothetical protein
MEERSDVQKGSLKRIGESECVVLHQTHRKVYVRERSTQEQKNAWEKGAYSDGMMTARLGDVVR